MSNEFLKFNSRRSTVYSTKGIVASTQPLANNVGLKILAKGGNCVDSCIAVAAALCLTEPGSTGIGGDCFALYYKSSTKQVLGLNGCGRSAKDLTIQDICDELNDGKPMARIPSKSVFSVVVPGAVAGWYDAFKSWGSGNVSFAELLQPAIDMAENGYPVCELAAHAWRKAQDKIISQNPDLDPKSLPILNDGKAPQEGDLMFNKPIAEAFKLFSNNADGYYKGPIAEAIIKTTDQRHHKLSLSDLSSHTSTFVDPIKFEFQGHIIWEIPPNGQGLVALVALGIIQELHDSGEIDLYSLKHNSLEFFHLLIECLKIGFYEGNDSITDPEFQHIPIHKILSKDHLRERCKLFNKHKVLTSKDFEVSIPLPDPKFKTDTTYFTVTDSNGDACSFINSVYESFGTGIIVPEYGFCLHSRGANFNLTPGATNCLEGGKRPYHTIIPSMITKPDGSFFASFGNMGGYMQPVGHVLHVMNLIIFNLTPQQSIDLPRFCLEADASSPDNGLGGDGPVSTFQTNVLLEEGIDNEVVEQLAKLGHKVSLVTDYKRSVFGRAQIIKNESKNGHLIYAAGSELRGDGAAVAF